MGKHTVLILFMWCFLGFYQANAQSQDYLDVLKINASLFPMADSQNVSGNFEIGFIVLQAVDSLFLDAVNIKVESGTFTNGIDYKTTADKIWFYSSFTPGKEYKLSFKYSAAPKQTLYFTGDQIWTQGQGKYTSHWLPSLDDMTDKIEFDLAISAPKEKTVIANGALKTKLPTDTLTQWHFDMQKPMSSYLVAFAVGDFYKSTATSASGVPLEMYIRTRDSSKIEATYKHSKQIFDFLESTIGVPYPWQNYKQVPVRDFLYAGMENTTATIFSESFVCDAIGFNDQNYINVNAHELAHQWFGNLVTEVSSKDHWLHEGFATFYALLAERELFGDDYYYWKLYQSAEQLKSLSEDGKGEALTDPKASSLTFYEKGAWALHLLREQLGAIVFNKAVAAYLQQYAYKNVTVDDFLTTVAAVSGKDLNAFKKDWLLQSSFNSSEVLESLKKSSFMRSYFETQALRTVSLDQKVDRFYGLLKDANDYLGQEVVVQLADEPLSKSLPLYQAAFETNNLYIRQAIAETLQKVPEALKSDYESLLDDASYVTQEAAFYNLWNSFPLSRTQYLEKLKTTLGFSSKNIRQLWLVLALITENYELNNKRKYLDELIAYCTKDYGFEVRELAFMYLLDLQVYAPQVLESLVNASVHHNWRFRNFAREKLKSLKTNSEVLNQLNISLATFSENEQAYLKREILE